MRGPGYGALLDAVRGVRWPARWPVGGALPGAHHSRQRGASSEFAEYRLYRQGDDPRRIDWRLLARSDRAYLRLATDRALLATTLVLDATASMAFPAPQHDKWRLAREVAIGLAAVAHAQGDPVGLVVPLTAAEARALPPRTRRGVVGEIAQALDAVEPGGTVPLAPACLRVGTRRVVVLTDLLGDAEALLDAARALMARDVEVHLVHVVAQDELTPGGATILATDPEDERVSRPLAGATIGGYQRAFAAWREEMAHTWRAAGAGYVLAATSQAPARVVRRVVDPRSGAA
ncbi:MAG TPA: DUF58 domain-containing protein [Gemmatimonadaceae bacterium]|nr:DUF58 domain-containing protein [Gemmatimonadaceae bacterium]